VLAYATPSFSHEQNSDILDFAEFHLQKNYKIYYGLIVKLKIIFFLLHFLVKISIIFFFFKIGSYAKQFGNRKYFLTVL